METAWKEAAEAFTKQWEQAASGFWDTTLREPATLDAMRAALLAVCAAKERSDQAVEQLWSQWRLPSATDVERLHERMGDLDERLARIETLLERLVAGGKPA
jgi:hypothetical protein